MKDLKWDEFFSISKSHKPSSKEQPDWEKVKLEIAEKLQVCDDALLRQSLKPLKKRYKRTLEYAQTSVKSCDREEWLWSQKDVVLRCDDLNPLLDNNNHDGDGRRKLVDCCSDEDEEDGAQRPRSLPRKSLDELGERQLRKYGGTDLNGK